MCLINQVKGYIYLRLDLLYETIFKVVLVVILLLLCNIYLLFRVLFLFEWKLIMLAILGNLPKHFKTSVIKYIIIIKKSSSAILYL